MWIRANDGTLYNLAHLQNLKIVPTSSITEPDSHWLYGDIDDQRGAWLEKYPTKEQADAALADLTAAIGNRVGCVWLRYPVGEAKEAPKVESEAADEAASEGPEQLVRLSFATHSVQQPGESDNAFRGRLIGELLEIVNDLNREYAGRLLIDAIGEEEDVEASS